MQELVTTIFITMNPISVRFEQINGRCTSKLAKTTTRLTSNKNFRSFIIFTFIHTRALIISQIVLDTMQQLGMSYPEVDKARRKELEVIRERLVRMQDDE